MRLLPPRHDQAVDTQPVNYATGSRMKQIPNTCYTMPSPGKTDPLV